MSSIEAKRIRLQHKSKRKFAKFCSSREDCVAFDPKSPECRKDNGCMTEENMKAYLELCRRAIEYELAKEEVS